MRYFELRYLTVGLPLITNTVIKKDGWSCEINEIEKGTTVSFSEIYADENVIKAKLGDNIVALNYEDLDLNYEFIAFPFFAEDLQPINEENIDSLKAGVKLVTGDADFYGEIGAGQVVEIVHIKIHPEKYVEEFKIRDQFGNEYESAGEMYLYDESKLNRDVTEIIDPIAFMKNNIEIKLSKDEITEFAKILAVEMMSEIKDAQAIYNTNGLSYAIIKAVQKFNRK